MTESELIEGVAPSKTADRRKTPTALRGKGGGGASYPIRTVVPRQREVLGDGERLLAGGDDGVV